MRRDILREQTRQGRVAALFRPATEQQSVLLWAIWHAAIAAALACLVPLATTRPFVPASIGLQGVALVGGYLALSLYIVPAARRSHLVLVVNLIIGAAVTFGGAYAVLRVFGAAVSPKLLAGGGVAAMVAALVPYLAWQARIPTIGALVFAAAGVGFVMWPNGSGRGPAVRTTASGLYSLSLATYGSLIAPPSADGGSIEGVGSSLLLATGEGKFYWLQRASGQESLSAAALPIRPPADRVAYFADFDDPAKAPRLRLTDIVLDPGATPQTLYAAHQAWNSGGRCYTMRVSAIALTWGADGVPTAASDWRTVFDTQPCVVAKPPFDDSDTGGRLAWAPDGRLLLTLGDMGFAGLDGNPPFSQSDEVDYGKILAVDPASGVAAVVSKGHRNPQGLTTDRQGRIWSSEHGPQGGDEVNLIVQGGNYGWPKATYGTNYGTRTWPLDPDGRDHGAFNEPAVAFVPSIATSALIEVRGDAFPRWDGDLLVSSLRTQSLFRMRLRSDRVIYTEPIHVGVRIRDLTQTDDGRIFIWSDAGIIIGISRTSKDTAFSLTCAGCHAASFGVAAGPSLAGVIGRDIASLPGFPYSAALRKLGGVWDDTALDAFLRDPNAFAPGTTMNIRGLDAATRAEVIAYLKNLKTAQD